MATKDKKTLDKTRLDKAYFKHEVNLLCFVAASGTGKPAQVDERTDFSKHEQVLENKADIKKRLASTTE